MSRSPFQTTFPRKRRRLLWAQNTRGRISSRPYPPQIGPSVAIDIIAGLPMPTDEECPAPDVGPSGCARNATASVAPRLDRFIIDVESSDGVDRARRVLLVH